MEQLNTAVIGCGIFGGIHAETYSKFERSNLLVVCDIDESRARAMAQRFNCRYTTRVEDVAADEDVHAVSVATPDFAHAEPCIRLAGAGKHILVEKPLALSVPDAQAVADAVARAGVIGMVDFHNRYNPAVASIKAKLEDGRIGSPQMMFARLSDRIEVATEWFAWAGRTGPQWFLGSHIADLACWLFGQDPVRVFAEGRKDVLAARGIDCYDSMHIHLSFPAGFATLETSWIMPNSWPMVVDFSVSVQATAGRADADLTRHAVTISDREEFNWPMLLGNTAVGEDTYGFFGFPIHDFVRAVLKGGPSPIDIREGVKNVKIIAAAVRSAETGKVVELQL